MTIHQICDRCGMEFDWTAVTAGDRIYCCAGCAAGTTCTCPVTTDDPSVITAGDTVVVGPHDVVIVD